MTDHDGHTIALDPPMADEHTGCGTKDCCGTCDTAAEQDIPLLEATKEQAVEAGIDLMVNILEIQQNLGMHLDVLNQVSMHLDELGATGADFAGMVREALKRHGIPAEHIEAAFTEMQLMLGAAEPKRLD